MNGFTRFTLFARGAVLLPAATAQAQTIAGTAKDTTGAVLPGVTVEASSDVLIERVRSGITDGSGRYAIIELRPGTYTVSDDTLKDSLANLRTPRQLFKFLHRLLEEHCHRHTEDAPRWTIDYDTFRTTYAAYMRDLEAFDRGFEVVVR